MSEKPLEKTPLEIITERYDKIEGKPEVYSSKKQFVIIFPNTYSVIVSDNNSRKHAKVEVYHSLENVTSLFFPSKTHRKVHRTIALALLEKIEAYSNLPPNEQDN